MSAITGIVHLDDGSVSSRDHSVTITSKTRLDNRTELCSWLDVRQHADLSDESLVVRAFERWGEACVHRLLGDWSFAAWQPAERRLLLARDHFGNTGLYFARVEHRVAFSSDLKSLATLNWVPRRLNETRVASLLVGGGVDDATSTIYRDVSCVPPAHTVTITQTDERLVRYWRVEDTPDSGPSDPKERARLLRDTLRAAVRSRLPPRRRAGAMLSGGLDSGGVTAFAAEYLSSQQRRLMAFTSVPAFGTGESRTGAGSPDEGPRAAQVVLSFDNIDHVVIKADSVTPVAGIRRGLAIHGEPSIAAANYVWIPELMSEAKSRGTDVMLTGQVGDFVMAGRPVASGWGRDWSERNYRGMLKRLTPHALQRLRGVDWQPWRLIEAPWRTFSVVSNELAEETRLVERLRDRQGSPRIARQAMSNVGAVWADLGATFGLTVVDPLQDKRVMELMFSGPRPKERGPADRWLFRQSLEGVLPEHVRLNRRKGIQSADIVERLRAAWAEVEEALAVAEASPLARRCVDLSCCRDLATAVRSGDDPRQSRRRAFTLVNGLSAALFLAETWQ